ncbi:hypothetical protein ABPG72_010825 [Tetrahymena utriculariae]
MQNQQTLGNKIKEFIESSVKLTQKIIIEQSLGSVVIKDLTPIQEKEILNTLNSLNNDKLLIESINFKDETINKELTKQISFTLKYSLELFNQKSVTELIKEKLKVQNCTIVPKQKLLYEGQSELRHYLSKDQIEQVQQNEEEKKKLLFNIQNLERETSDAKKSQDEKGKLITKLTQEKDELKAQSTNFQKEKNAASKTIKDLAEKTNKLVDEGKEKEKIIKQQEAKISELLKKIEENDQKVKTKENYKQLQSDVEAKEEQIKKQEQLIKTLQNDIQNCKDLIQNLQQQIQTLEIKISDQEISNLDFQKDIYQLNEKINVYEEQIKQYDIYLKQ